jgi:hypothetical protein
MRDLHPNLLTYLAAVAAFNRDDLTAIAEHVHPDFVYRIPPRAASGQEPTTTVPVMPGWKAQKYS